MNLTAGLASRFLLLAVALCAAAVPLSSCAPLIVGGAAAGAVLIVTDRRTSGIQIEDQNLVFKAESQIRQQFGDTVRIDVMAYNRQVLLTGDVPSNAVKSEVGAMVQRIENVKSVFNQLKVGPIASLGVRSHDTWLTSKVKTALINTKHVPSRTIGVTTDRDVVYLMGKVTEAESNYAATTASEVSGVIKVVKLFEIISNEEALRLSGAHAEPSHSNTSTEHTPTTVESSSSIEPGHSGVQTLPVK
jgi:osmotically-inducible protein OsmY